MTKTTRARYGYGDFYWRSSERDKAQVSWIKAAELASGTSEESRKAFITANQGLVRAASANGDITSLNKFAADIDRRRHPEDAWVLGTLSTGFFFVELFDKAIDYAQRALKLMNYGAGRRFLATALYAKACDEFKAGRPWQDLFRQARGLGFEPGDVAQYFQTVKPGAAAARRSILSSLPELPPQPGEPTQNRGAQPAIKS